MYEENASMLGVSWLKTFKANSTEERYPSIPHLALMMSFVYWILHPPQKKRTAPPRFHGQWVKMYVRFKGYTLDHLGSIPAAPVRVTTRITWNILRIFGHFVTNLHLSRANILGEKGRSKVFVNILGGFPGKIQHIIPSPQKNRPSSNPRHWLF